MVRSVDQTMTAIEKKKKRVSLSFQNMGNSLSCDFGRKERVIEEKQVKDWLV